MPGRSRPDLAYARRHAFPMSRDIPFLCAEPGHCPTTTFMQVRAVIIDHGLTACWQNVGRPADTGHRRCRVDVGSTLVDVRRRSWTCDLHRRCVRPFDLWVENPIRRAVGASEIDHDHRTCPEGWPGPRSGGDRECSEQLGQRHGLVRLVLCLRRGAAIGRKRKPPPSRISATGHPRAGPLAGTRVRAPAGCEASTRGRLVVAAAGLLVRRVAEWPRGCRPRSVAGPRSAGARGGGLVAAADRGWRRPDRGTCACVRSRCSACGRYVE